MNNLSKVVFSAALISAGLTQQVQAIPFEPSFSDYSFPGSQFTVDSAANTFFNSTYGINIDNAYLYVDNRDSFDGIGVANGTVVNLSQPGQRGRIDFLDTTDFVSIDYVTLLDSIYSAYDSTGALIESVLFSGASNGSHLFSTSSRISYLTWESTGGYAGISGLRYDYDGTTDGHNDDLDDVGVPEPGSMALLGLGLAALSFARRKSKSA